MEGPELIPKFYLYGETCDHDDSEFVHIESIAARSEKEFWTIKPHRHGKLLQIVMVTKGEATVSLDHQTCHVTQKAVVVIPSSVVHGFIFAPHTQGYVLTIAEPLINQSTDSRAVEYLNFVTQTARILCFKPTSQFFTPLCFYLENMLQEFHSYYTGKHYSIEWTAKMILITLYREIETHENIIKPNDINQKFYQFSNLIEALFRQQVPVAEYASQLGISLSTLNRLCHKQKGESAKQLINNRLFIEAKRRLLYTQAHIDQIAYGLGFDDPAYFSRFFKQKSGLSPKAFREINPFETEY